jgi:hypothetical protein
MRTAARTFFYRTSFRPCNLDGLSVYSPPFGPWRLGSVYWPVGRKKVRIRFAQRELISY